LRLDAAMRALELLYAIAGNDSAFRVHDGHFLLAFALIGTTSRHATLRRRALDMGRERARHWLADWSRVRARLDADSVLQAVISLDAAGRLGMQSAGIRRDLRAVVARYSTPALLYFDPATEAPPTDVPEDCACDYVNARGRRSCQSCRRRLKTRSAYDIWYYALTNVYFCERQRIQIGARLSDVMRHLASLRPYPRPDARDHYQAIYAVTHAVYVSNDYGRHRLAPQEWARELAFLKACMRPALERREPDTVGEIIDSLLALGVADTHPLIAAGRTFLVETQQPDGGWGGEGDDYGRFHALWTAIDGLRDHLW
jgi:hypothetical protein